MISLICILIASFFNAVMDTVENENFFESIFKRLDQQFWYKRESWKHAKKIFGYRIDAWHLSKSLMVVFFCLAIYLEQLSNQIWHTSSLLLDIPIDVCVAGVIWNLGFTLFYHHVFRVK